MSVDFELPAYKAKRPLWLAADDVCAGQDAVKSKRVAYLPKPNPTDLSKENDARYAQYVERAVFYAYTQRTLYGMGGMVYRKPCEITLPSALKYAETNANGSGLGLERLTQLSLFDVMKSGRAALLVDFPNTEIEISRADIAKGYNPYIRTVQAVDVINWRMEQVGGQYVLTLAVIRESVDISDGYTTKAVLQYRALELIGGVYTVSLWRSVNSSELQKVAEYMPRDASGNVLDFILFQFIGAKNNDAEIDDAPLQAIVDINLAHYRNSADYEDSVFIVGQPQAYLAGLTDQWRDWLVNEGIYFGARSPFLLPEGGSAGILQAAPNSLAKEAMEHKEKQMVALGAMLMSEGSAVKTATQSDSETTMQHSVLSLCVVNVEDAYNKALEWMGLFAGSPAGTIEINKEFSALRLEPQMLTALIGAWQSGKLPDSDLWANLRKYGVIDELKDDETIKDELGTQDAGLALDGNHVSNDSSNMAQ